MKIPSGITAGGDGWGVLLTVDQDLGAPVEGRVEVRGPFERDIAFDGRSRNPLTTGIGFKYLFISKRLTLTLTCWPCLETHRISKHGNPHHL